MLQYSKVIGIYQLDLMLNEYLISMEDFEVMHMLLEEIHWDHMHEILKVNHIAACDEHINF